MSSSTWTEEITSEHGVRLGWIVTKWDNTPVVVPLQRTLHSPPASTTWTAVPAPGNPKAWLNGSVEFSDRETAHAHLRSFTTVAGD